MEPLSVDFLVSNNFDFNKVFQKGVSFSTKRDEDRILQPKQPAAAADGTPISPIQITKEEDKTFIQTTLYSFFFLHSHLIIQHNV
jgi:hypothetical protein